MPTSDAANPSANQTANQAASLLQGEIEHSLALDASLPGIVAFVHAPRIGLEWAGACGTVAHGGEDRLAPSHAFRIASATKPYTSAVALRLSERGQFDLFAPIAPLLAAETRSMLSKAGYAPDRITAYHLLTHGSGLRDHAGRDTPYGEAVLRDPAHVWTHAEQIEFCMSLGGPLSDPATHFSYSDTGYLILGDLMERVTGRPLHELMRELLHFDRLGLVETHFERLELAPAGQLRAGQYFEDIDVSTLDCSCDLSGGGGLISTTDELARFFRAAARGELFDRPETLALALATPSLRLASPTDALHSPLMRGRWVGDEPSHLHGGFWGVMAAYCPASDVALALSFNQVMAGESTLGLPAVLDKPSLADRLARIVQRASKRVAP